MKKTILLLALIVFTASLKTFAQDSSMAAGRMKKMHGQGQMQGGGARQAMLDSLNLSASQREQLKTEMADLKQKRSEIKSDSTLSSDARMEKMKELREEEKKKMQSILTADQQKKYAEMMKNQRDKNGEQ